MKKPHIRKVKGSPYWCCNGLCAKTVSEAYRKWDKRRHWLRDLGVTWL